MEQSWSVKDLTDFAGGSIRNAREDTRPFDHLEFDCAFPPELYAGREAAAVRYLRQS